MGMRIEGIRFLLVEDNDHMRRLVRLIIQSMGVESIIEARDGSDALVTMRQEGPPDILITDWMMSPMDGLELTRYIRKSEHSPNRFLPIIMMTGFAERKRVFAARDAGVTEFLVKPLSAISLFSRIQAIVEKPRQFVQVGEFFGPDRRAPQGRVQRPGAPRQGSAAGQGTTAAARRGDDSGRHQRPVQSVTAPCPRRHIFS